MLDALERLAQEVIRKPCKNVARRLFFRQSPGGSLTALSGKFRRDAISQFCAGLAGGFTTQKRIGFVPLLNSATPLEVLRLLVYSVHGAPWPN
jgi:hypothetical protein